MRRPPILVGLLACASLSCSSIAPAPDSDSASVKALFADPPREYSTAPLWVWNDMLTEAQVVGTLRDLAAQNVRQVFVHPRPGLMTPYLSADWFRLWKVALAEAERLDMNVWIYDENSYPSGFAGGFVPEAMPESRGRGLMLEETKDAPRFGPMTLAAFRLGDSEYEDVSGRIRAGEKLPEGRYLVATVARAPDSPWHGGRSYVDLLYPGVTEKFLEITLGAYRREVGAQFGRRIPGIFTDEPQLLPAGGLPWTDGIPEAFERRWGYPLTDNLPALSLPLGDWKRVRHNYYQVLLERFIERWGRPYHEACAREGLEFTGHYWEHEWPRCGLVPDNMAMAAWQQRPGIDTLMNQYDEGTHGQFGNVRAVKEVASVANQLGMRRTLCEAYGAGGWDLRFVDMKRIADWLLVLGINTIDEHLSYITLRGARKKDHPQSFSYHEPWWDAYHVRATYAARLCAALSQGEQVNPFLILEPTTSAWMYQQDGPRLEGIGNAFQSLLVDLERAQVEYDIGCEDVLARHGGVSGSRLVVGKRSYRAIVLPPGMENLNLKTALLLGTFVQRGGIVIASCDPPALVDGSPSELGGRASKSPGWRRVEAREVPSVLASLINDNFAIRRSAEDKGVLLHHRRRLTDGELLFLANTSEASPCSGTVLSRAHGVETWSPATGEARPCSFAPSKDGVEVPFELPPAGSLLLFLSREPRAPSPARPLATRTIEPVGPPEVRRDDPNVLVIDHLDVTAGGETRRNAFVYQAQQFAFKKNGMDRNPWDSAVQFRDETISRQFPKGSGFTATYRFTIEIALPDSLFAVIERPDLYRITVNGTPVTAKAGDWWLDHAFGKIDIRSVARIGENTIELEASPFSVYHEIEAAIILGEFGVKAADAGFVIVPGGSLTLGPWNEQLHPFYGSSVAYSETFDVGDAEGTYSVHMPDWYGSVARVAVNGIPAGYIEAPPWKLALGGEGGSSRIKRGLNTIEVVVVGTLKNTLGPHHAGSPRGTAWPGMFHQAPDAAPPPGAKYDTIGYGLMKPFVLEQETAMEGSTRAVDLARDLIADHEARIRPLEVGVARAWWNANTTGKDEDFKEKEEAQNRLDAALADTARFSRLSDARKGLAAAKADPLLARQIEVLWLQALEKQVDPELLRRMSAKSNVVEKAFNVYRARVDEKDLTDSEVRKILKESKDQVRRKSVWEASKGVGSLVEADLRELVKLRNEAARRLGYGDFHALQLAINEQSRQSVLALFDELERLIRGPFRAMKAEIDAKLAVDYGIPVSELRPWHYQDPFFQEAPAVYPTDLDEAYVGRDIPTLCREFYAGIGLPVEDVLSRSDLFERKGKSPHAFCTDIDRQGDVRVLANIVPNEYWMGTMLHELGHAVYSSKNMPRELPYALRTEAHILTTEGIAMLLEKFSKSASFLGRLGVPVADPRAFDETATPMRRDRLLIFAAWCQVMLRFEAAMYQDPDQDLNALWWDLVERYQEVRRPERRNAPDYASKIHVVSAPAYYHNYMMGELFAAQLHHAIARDVLKTPPDGAIYNDRKDVGDFLKAKVFSLGRSLSWNDLTREATGEELNAKAFAADIAAR